MSKQLINVIILSKCDTHVEVLVILKHNSFFRKDKEEIIVYAKTENNKVEIGLKSSKGNNLIFYLGCDIYDSIISKINILLNTPE